MDHNIIYDYYTRDIETEDFIRNGSLLVEGAVVLGYHYNLFVDLRTIDPEFYEKAYLSARINNRWCTVKNLKVDKDKVTFTGVYADGWEVERETHIGYPWIAKKDPVRRRASEYTKPDDESFVVIYNEVKNALILLDTEIHRNGSTQEKIYQIAEAYAHNIHVATTKDD